MHPSEASSGRAAVASEALSARATLDAETRWHAMRSLLERMFRVLDRKTVLEDCLDITLELLGADRGLVPRPRRDRGEAHHPRAPQGQEPHGGRAGGDPAPPGWRYEALYRMVGHSWLNVTLVGNAMIGGLEQSKFFPTGNVLIGFELKNSFQLGAGANLAPLKGQEAHTIFAARGHLLRARACVLHPRRRRSAPPRHDDGRHVVIARMS